MNNGEHTDLSRARQLIAERDFRGAVDILTQSLDSGEQFASIYTDPPKSSPSSNGAIITLDKCETVCIFHTMAMWNYRTGGLPHELSQRAFRL